MDIKYLMQWFQISYAYSNTNTNLNIRTCMRYMCTANTLRQLLVNNVNVKRFYKLIIFRWWYYDNLLYIRTTFIIVTHSRSSTANASQWKWSFVKQLNDGRTGSYGVYYNVASVAVSLPHRSATDALWRCDDIME